MRDLFGINEDDVDIIFMAKEQIELGIYLLQIYEKVFELLHFHFSYL